MTNGRGRRVRGLSRRDFLGLGGATFLVTAPAGCDLLSTEPRGEDKKDGQGASGAGRKGREAPMLAEMVKNGELPTVEERLPEEPLVVEPVERIGQYGGEWNSTLLGPTDLAWLDRTIGYENLMRWTPDWEDVIPNVAESVEANEAGTEFTFRLRRGMRWSDGEPFTADDIVFTVEDVFNNEEITPAPDDNPPTAEKVDDYTVRITFEQPEGLFLLEQASPLGSGWTNKPFHYLKRFHKKHNPDVEELAEEQGFDGWVELFGRKGGTIEGTPYNAEYQNPELPTLHAWMLTVPLGEGNRVVAERNPYYWKTDPDGSQLPYIDRMIYDVVNNEEVTITRTLNGNVDMIMRPINTLQNKPVFAQNRERGDYRFVDAAPADMNTIVIQFNLTHQDETKRGIFQNKDFRIGLSHAINREEIIDVVYQEQGEPWQAAPRPESPFHNEEFAKQYTEYSVEKANAALDKAGYTERGGNGIRLGPDGEPISFPVEVDTASAERIDALELIRGYWREVGIDMNVKTRDGALIGARTAANEHDAVVGNGGGGLRYDLVLRPNYYFPSSGPSRYAVPWAQWYETGGSEGQEPPEETRQQMELYDRLRTTTDEEKRIRLMREIIEIAKERFYCIGINLTPAEYLIVKNELRNVTDSVPDAYLYLTPAPTNPEQYFIRR